MNVDHKNTPTMELRFPLLLLLSFFLSPFSWGQSEPEPLRQGTVLGIHFIQARADTDPVEGEQFLKDEYFPTLHDLFPDNRLLQLRGERGEHEQRTAMVWIYADTASHTFSELAETTGQPELEGAFYRFNDGLTDSLSTEYRIIDVGEPMSNKWLRPGAILGLHQLQLKPGTDPAEFEQFVHKIWAPNRSDALPNSKMIFLKGVSGQREGQYSYLWIIDSEETRDFYFPQSGTPSQHYTDFESGWSWLDEEAYLGRFLAEDGEDIFTDYVVVQ